MKVSRWLILAAATPLALAGCGAFGDAMSAHTDVVARAAGHELKVEDAARLLAGNPDVPADPSVVQMLADIWVDYTLLGTAAAEDTTLAVIDMESFTQEAREQQLLMKLRNEVVRPDTVFTDEQIQQRWITDGPGAEIRARHILLRIPADATDAQRQELRQQAEQLRAQAAGGADFASLAQQHSQDPGSAQRGGDLGFFGRGRMVAPFEEAAFALQPGEVSDVVESPFGYHVIRLEERRQPDITPERDQFRQYLVQQAEQEAETRYIDSLTAASNVQVRPGGLAVVREIAQKPDAAVRGRAAAREIATYTGGTYTSGNFASFIRAQPPHVQSAFATATDDQLEGVVTQLARKEVLVREAQQRGIQLTAEEDQEIRNEARQAIREVLQGSGFADPATRGGSAAALGARVRELIEGAIRGDRQLVPLGPLAFALRQAYPSEVNENAFAQVVRRVEELRAESANGVEGAPTGPTMQPMYPMAPGTPQSPGAPPAQPAMPENHPALPETR
jgi:parvulin-like peptidyl-prolyl isomerase